MSRALLTACARKVAMLTRRAFSDIGHVLSFFGQYLLELASDSRTQTISLAIATFLTASFLSLRLPYVHNFRAMGMQSYSFAKLAEAEPEKSEVYKELAVSYLTVSEEYRHRTAYFSRRVFDGFFAMGLFALAGIARISIEITHRLRNHRSKRLPKASQYVTLAFFVGGYAVLVSSVLFMLVGWFTGITVEGVGSLLTDTFPGILRELPHWPWIEQTINATPYLQHAMRP